MERKYSIVRTSPLSIGTLGCQPRYAIAARCRAAAPSGRPQAEAGTRSERRSPPSGESYPRTPAPSSRPGCDVDRIGISENSSLTIPSTSSSTKQKERVWEPSRTRSGARRQRLEMNAGNDASVAGPHPRPKVLKIRTIRSKHRGSAGTPSSSLRQSASPRRTRLADRPD